MVLIHISSGNDLSFIGYTPSWYPGPQRTSSLSCQPYRYGVDCRSWFDLNVSKNGGSSMGMGETKVTKIFVMFGRDVHVVG